MTPVLPSFAGFLPRNITRVLPNSQLVNVISWKGLPLENTNVTFLQPTDPMFAQLQKSFLTKQEAAYGNISHAYTLDQFNENTPGSGDLEYLKNVTYSTWESLKAVDSDAIWVMLVWMFHKNKEFWTKPRIEAYLSGVENPEDMLILDLFSESFPQWQRTESYFGKRWIWNQLHGFGGSEGMYGQIMNITINPIEALALSNSLVGIGLTIEGQEGNEIMYGLLLDQAWSRSPIDTETYFHNFVTSRYTGTGDIPNELYTGWEIMRETAYNNTNLNSPVVGGVMQSIIELSPNITGMISRAYCAINYDPALLADAWKTMYAASKANLEL